MILFIDRSKLALVSILICYFNLQLSNAQQTNQTSQANRVALHCIQNHILRLCGTKGVFYGIKVRCFLSKSAFCVLPFYSEYKLYNELKSINLTLC